MNTMQTTSPAAITLHVEVRPAPKSASPRAPRGGWAYYLVANGTDAAGRPANNRVLWRSPHGDRDWALRSARTRFAGLEVRGC